MQECVKKNSGSPKQAYGATPVKATLPVQVAGRGGVRLLSVVPILFCL